VASRELSCKCDPGSLILVKFEVKIPFESNFEREAYQGAKGTRSSTVASSDTFTPLLTCGATFPRLQELRLCACRLPKEQLQQLAAELAKLTTLTRLDVREQGVLDGTSAVDADTFKALAGLQNLQL
jgi:hypothetical protein